jgi:hypothetical protein
MAGVPKNIMQNSRKHNMNNVVQNYVYETLIRKGRNNILFL